MKEQVTNEENKAPGQEKAPGQILSKGEERYNAISNSLKKARSKMGSWFSKAGSFLKKGAFGVLATPEAVVAGTKYTGTKIAEGSVYAADKVVQGTEYTADKIVQGAEFIADKTVEGGEYISGKAEQLGSWVGEQATSVYDFSAEKYQKAKVFTQEKGQQIKNYTRDKADLAVAVGSLMKEKTVEKLNTAKEGLASGYNNVMEYGKNAVDSATLRAQKIKENFKTKWNAFRMDMLKRKAEIQKERLERTTRKLAQFNQVVELGNKLD